MFGTNSITGAKYFAEAKGQLMVTSIFYTLQGEGPFSGRPAIFLRLSKCQLQCPFCDTHFDTGLWMLFDEIWTRLQAVHPHINNVGLVITGGEPTLQAELTPFLQMTKKMFAWVQIESNGLITRELPEWVSLVISPKAREGIDRYLRPNLEMLERALALKFVIAKDDPVYGSVPSWAFDWRIAHRDRNIYVSPMNVYKEKPAPGEVVSFWKPGLIDMERAKANHEHAAYLAMNQGLILSLQQHIYASIA